MNWKLLSILFIGYHVLKETGGQLLNRLSIGRPKIKFGSFRPSGLQPTLTFPVSNSPPASIPFSAFQGQVLYGNFPLSDVYLNSPQVVQGGSTSDIVFNVILDMSKFSGSLVDLVSSGNYLQSLRLKGHLTSAGVVVPSDRTLQLLTL